MTYNYTPEIESGVPIEDALPVMTEDEELLVRANTAKLLADLTNTVIDPEPKHKQSALEIFKKQSKQNLPLSAYPNETIAYLAGMVSLYDGMVVRELADLKLYVVNRLLEETTSKDAKIRVAALRMLGEIDGVDAFKKRTEITIQQKSTEEIESELMDKLNRLTVDMGAVQEAKQEEAEEVDEGDEGDEGDDA